MPFAYKNKELERLEKEGVEATIIVKNRATGEIVQQYNFDMTETDIIEMCNEMERIFTKKKYRTNLDHHRTNKHPSRNYS